MKNELLKVGGHQSLRENYGKACEKFIREQARNLQRTEIKFERTNLLFGFRNALRKIYDEIEQEKELVMRKARDFDRKDEELLSDVEDTRFALEKRRNVYDFIDLHDKICYDFAKKEVGIWRLYGHIPEREYMLLAFEDALGKVTVEMTS